MLCHDPQQQEEGFALLQAHAAGYVNELMAEFARQDSHGLRCWLLELIGQVRSHARYPC